MSAISIKSISGITSITTPAGVDNQFTLHNNNTTEAVKLDTAGNFHFHNHLNITGISTAANFKTGTSNLHSTGLNIFDLDVDGQTNLDHVSVAGITTFNNNVHLLDNDYIRFGSSQDLSIFHDGTNNWFWSGGGHPTIHESSGSWTLRSVANQNYIIATENNSVDLYYSGTKRFETTSTGASVTGNFGASGNISLSGSFIMPDSLLHANDNTTRIRFPAPSTFSVDTAGSERLRIDSGGRLQIGASNNTGSNTKFVVGFGNNINTTAIINTGDVDTNALTLSNWDGSTTTNKVMIAFDNSGNGGFDIGMPAGSADFAFQASGGERLRISSSGELRVPAGIGAQLKFENQHSVTTDAAISTYDDATGTLLCLGSNFYFNSSGSETRYNTGEESAGIVVNRNGYITFFTGSTGATGVYRFGIASDGKVLIDNSTGTLTIGGDNVYDSAKINLMVGNSSQTSATTEATALVIHDQNSRRNGTEGTGSWKSKIVFRSTQINGNNQSEGASIVHDITYNNYSSTKMRSDLVFKTRGDAQTASSDAATEKLRIRHDGNVGINENAPQKFLHVTGNTTKGAAHFGIFGTNGGNAYIGNTPVVTISTDGNANAGTNDEKALFQVGRGGGGAGATAVTTEHFRVNLGGTVQIGGAVASNSHIDVQNTKLTIKQSANSREDGIYIERVGEGRGWLQYVGGGGGVNDGFCLSTNQLGSKMDVLAFDRNGRMYFINNNGVGAWFGALTSATSDTATVNMVSTSDKEASIGLSRSNSLGGDTGGLRISIQSDAEIAFNEHISGSQPLRVRNRITRTQYGIDTQSNNGTLYTPGRTGFHGTQWMTCGAMFPFFYLGERVSSSSSNYSAEVLDIYASGHWNGYPKAVIIAHERYYKNGFATWTFGPYINGSYTLEQVEGWGGYSGAHGNDRNGTVSITHHGSVNTHSGQPIHRYTVTIANSGTYSYTRWYIGFVHTGRGVFMSDTSVADVTSSTSSGACCHMRDITQASAGDFNYMS